jgi:glyoxylase-like metal-dependent hydrolase (beta-lactamase superfamily II)
MPRHETLAAAFAAAGLVVFERGWLSSNNVLFLPTRDCEAVLIDSSYWSHQDQTVALVGHALGERRLARVINTHLHSDHCGGNAALRRTFGCEVLVPSGEEAKARAWDEDLLTYRATGQHCPRFDVHAAVPRGGLLELGGQPWEVIDSPGHDPESFVLYQPESRLLISADALWEYGFGVVFPELEGKRAFDDVRDTLETLSSLAVDWVIPGHGRGFGSVPEAMERARRRLSGFIDDPRKHAVHASRVLVKFHLLEVRSIPLDRLLDWIVSVPYMRRLHRDHFAAETIRAWAAGVVSDLCRSTAARVDGQMIHDA